MKKITAIFLALIIVLSFAGCGIGSKPYEHKEGNDAVAAALSAKTTKYEPGCKAEKYTMDITLDTDVNTVSGTVTVDLTNKTSSALSDICFRLFSCSIKGGENSAINSAKNAKTKTEYTVTPRDDTSVIYINLGEDAIQPGKTISLNLDFTSVIPDKGDRYGCYTSPNGKLYNLTFCFPQIAFLESGVWFEDAYTADSEALYNAMSDYYVTFKAPKEYAVLATGNSETKDGVTTIEAKNVREMAITACDFAEIETKTENGIEYNIMKPNYDIETPEFREDYYDFLLTVAIESVEIFSEKIGDYIYDELDIVPIFYDSSVAGMEYPGFVQVSMFAENENADDKDKYNVAVGAISTTHEVGHEWFYCAVGNNESDEPWLDEGFTSYLENYYMMVSKDGAKAYESFMKNYMQTEDFFDVYSWFGGDRDGDGKEEPGELAQGDAYINFDTTAYLECGGYDYSTYVYTDGAHFVRGLELIMGEEKFDKMMQDWYAENTNGIVDGVAFIQHLMKYDSSDKIKKFVNDFISDENLN